MKFRKKLIIDATQWFKNGDHPADGNSNKEGKIVRYFNHPLINGDSICSSCNSPHKEHGYIYATEGAEYSNYSVCPKDWIITETEGEYYPCDPATFDKVYEPVEQ